MSQEYPILYFRNNTIKLSDSKGVKMWRGDNGMTKIANKDIKVVDTSPASQWVSGLKDGRKMNAPYTFYPTSSGGIRIEVYNSTHQLKIQGESPTKHTKGRGIVIEEPGSKKASIREFKFRIDIPENEEEEEEEEKPRNRYSNQNSNDSSSGRDVDTELLEKIDKALSNVEKKNVPLVRDFWEEVNQIMNNHSHSNPALYVKESGDKYYVSQIEEALRTLRNKNLAEPGDAIRVSSHNQWDEKFEYVFTSMRDIRFRVGDLWLWNESNDLVLGNPSREERINKIE